MLRRRAFLTQTGQAVLAAALAAPGAGSPRTRQAPFAHRTAAVSMAAVIADLEKRIPSWMHRVNVPGLAIVLVQNAAVVWRRGFGLRDAASKAAVDDETMFEAASMSKPVFAYVVMKLCETGVMDLDTPLSRYAAAPYLHGDRRQDLITARHVLSHTSGFQNWRSEQTPLAIHFTPGDRFLYSGEGYHYLQTVVTKLLGQPFETYMNARLFGPLGMSASRYVWDDTAARRMARPHDPDGRPTVNTRSTSADVARYGSAGALLTTPSDYATFLINVIDPGPADAIRLTRKNITEMLRPHVKVDGPFPASWALGWQVFHNPNRDFVYHGGDNRGFHCSAVASVEGKSGFVAMTNGENGSSVLRSLLTAESMQAFLGG